ncbi:MAG: tRNA (adenosine(37)-N6)-threonylcarbamoyltransferase complex dimerization subunit type 1 TsaB [Fimbriimonadaceae bacterium]
MILVLSATSPLVSVALLDTAQGTVVAAAEKESPRAASGTAIGLIDALFAETGRHGRDIGAIVADVGPGSFTGVKVSVTLAKTLAYSLRVPVAGVAAFDLVSPDRVVAIGGKPGHWFVRTPGCEPECRSGAFPSGAVGYGPGVEDPVFPAALRAGALAADLDYGEPARLQPLYVAEPNISAPKVPYRRVPDASPRDGGNG